MVLYKLNTIKLMLKFLKRNIVCYIKIRCILGMIYYNEMCIIKYRHMVLYGHVQNIYNVKLMLKILNRNICRYKHMYITLE